MAAEYDGRTALLVVDVQNDFAHPEGSLYVAGGEEVVPFVNEQVEAALASGAVVVYSQDWHPQSTPHFVTEGGIWPVHCVADTWGAEFHAGLMVAGEVVRKGTGGEDGYSAFTMRDPDTGDERSTGLADLLRDREVRRVVVVGIATDYCVVESVVDAAAAGFVVEVMADGMRAVNLAPGDGARAVARMAACGAAVR